MFKTRFLPALALTALVSAPLAHAQTSGCNNNTSGNDMIGRLANKENCLNDRVQNWQNKNHEAAEAREKKLTDLRDKYTNAPERERQKIQNKIDDQKNKLNEIKQERTQRIDQFRSDQKEQHQRMKALSDKTKQDFRNLGRLN
ncbi:hypothetical protein C0V97_11270 [Asaia sp. W19]|uniref:hypothetical protein n=1 Tax=unclassified Asaia TaxID=2685023 RepID=UPI000F8D05B8|nr:hypothetical protein [Asaia sp. W19]RUT25495.1 hypothetical protein C0V97_11270 [Asaia sp. W19]